jgi:transposase
MSQYTTQTLEHLGLVGAMVDELGIVSTLDTFIEQDSSQRNVSVGVAVKAMILNGLGFANRQLYLIPQFFENKPLDRLLGEGIESSHLNDKVLGRALDTLYEKGVTALFGIIAAEGLKRLGITSEYLHLDSTAFHVDGAYTQTVAQDTAEPSIIKITQGYSKDHRPDLNQVMLNMIVENTHGIPVAMRALSGNTSDKAGFEAMVKEHVALIQKVPTGTIIADSALYSASSLASMKALQVRWITRVPETMKESKEIIQASKKKEWIAHTKDTRYSYTLHQSNYADVIQQWVIVYSTEANMRTRSTLERRYTKQSNNELDEITKLSNECFACEADALKAVEKLKKSLKLTHVETTVNTIVSYSKRGRPIKDTQPDRVEYAITCTAFSSSLDPYYQDLHKGSCFILASNDLAHKPEEIIDAYKNQYVVERGFRFLKSPEFLADSLFLKKPQRIEALLMIMTLCLLVYSALEYKIRSTLQEQPPFYPDQKGKPILTPTTRWVFQTFIDVHVLSIDTAQYIVTNIKEYNRQLLTFLGHPYLNMYESI